MKIAFAQLNSFVGDIKGNKRKIISFIKEAVLKETDMIIFPELAITGYPPMDLLYDDEFIQLNLSALNEIVSFSSDISIVCGFVDVSKTGCLYNSAAFLSGGKIQHVQHKTLLPVYDVFDEARYFKPSEEQRIVEYRGIKILLTVCEDIWNDIPFDKKAVYLESGQYERNPLALLESQNVDLIINISASPFSMGKTHGKILMFQEICRKYQTAMAYVNLVGGNDSLVFDGRSLYINQRGEILAASPGYHESLIIADTDSSEIYRIEDNELEELFDALVLGTRDYIGKCGFSKAVVGLSGGIDSALTAAVAVEALGAENVHGITMPSRYSSKGSVDDSRQLAFNLGITLDTIPIEKLFTAYLDELQPVFHNAAFDVTEENLQARIRGNLLMAFSNKTGAILLSTGNKSELAMGYCTLYGDMSGGLAVISDLPKTLVYRLSEYINRDHEIIPVEIIKKPPSAELRDDQKDEDFLPPYDILDQVLEMYIEKRMSASEILAAGYNKTLVYEILKTVNRNEYKRKQSASGLKITSKAFGSGRRFPVAMGYLK